MKMRITMEGEIKNVSLVGLATISCLCYCHFISARLQKGKWRLISLVPIFCIFTILPLYTTTVFFTVGAAALLTWLANFKLLLFAFNRGPLASFNNINLPIFITMAALPFRIKPKKPSKKLKPVSGKARIQESGELDSDGAPNGTSRFKIPYIHGILILNIGSLIPRLYIDPPLKQLTLSLTTEIPVFVIVVSILQECNKYTHSHIVVFLLYWCFSFLFIEIVCELSSLIVYLLLGLELHPPSNKPYLSTSLQDFWGRRWNLTMNHIMRETVYKPVRSATGVVLGKDWVAAAVAVVATFLVSGLVHELMLWYVTRGSPSWETTLFFVFQGVCVVAEFGLKVVLVKKGWRLPWFVSRLLTVGFLVVTGFWMLWPLVRRSGADVRAIEELRLVGEVAKECVVEVWVRAGCKWV